MENNPINTFNEIYERMYPSVRAYFSRRFNSNDAEDLTQITFMKLWAYLPNQQMIKNERALVFRIAKNVRADRLRQHDIQLIFDNISKLENLKTNNDFTTEIELQLILSELSSEDRELVELCRLGWSSKEIGKIQGVSASAIRSRKQVLRKKLKNMLEI